MKTSKTKQHFAEFKLITIAVIMIARVACNFSTEIFAQGDPAQPVRYLGEENIEISQPDGGVRMAVGVQNYQVLRSFRNDSAASDGFGWTYHHSPMIHYRNKKMYLLCNSAPKDEDKDKGHVLLFTSSDFGRTWSFPAVVFPEIMVNVKGVDQWTSNNQRIGWWTSPSGRLYAMSGYYPVVSGNAGDDCERRWFGIAVRESKNDTSFGDIFFIADNPDIYDRATLPFPYYTESSDKDFISDCNILRADKLVTLHWWEQILPENFPFPQSLVEFIKIKGDRKFAKAISYFHRPDSSVVALWKMSYSSLSFDNGLTWTQPVQLKTMGAGYDKIWGQRTDDGRFACTWTPRASGYRYPLIIATGTDGVNFDNMLSINDECYIRYPGSSKNEGASNYQRGLLEGNSDIPGTDMWLGYSMSKEDIWVSRIPTPIRGSVRQHINDNFDKMETEGVVTDWNIYSPKYAPVRVVEFPGGKNKSLELRDMDPSDFAKAQRVFPESQKVRLTFKVLTRQTSGELDIDVRSQTSGNYRPVRIWFDTDGNIKAEKGKGNTIVLMAYQKDIWYSFVVDIDTKAKKYAVNINMTSMLKDALFSESGEVSSVERLVFRTGPYRGVELTNFTDPEKDHPVEPSVFYIDDVTSKTLK